MTTPGGRHTRWYTQGSGLASIFGLRQRSDTRQAGPIYFKYLTPNLRTHYATLPSRLKRYWVVDLGVASGSGCGRWQCVERFRLPAPHMSYSIITRNPGWWSTRPRQLRYYFHIDSHGVRAKRATLGGFPTGSCRNETKLRDPFAFRQDDPAGRMSDRTCPERMWRLNLCCKKMTHTWRI